MKLAEYKEDNSMGKSIILAQAGDNDYRLDFWEGPRLESSKRFTDLNYALFATLKNAQRLGLTLKIED